MVDAAALLRERRLAAGLTQAQLAARLGVTQPTVAAWERRGANPTVRTLERALEATGHVLEVRGVQRRPGVDATLIREHLRLSPGARLGVLEQLQHEARRLGSARRVPRAA